MIVALAVANKYNGATAGITGSLIRTGMGSVSAGSIPVSVTVVNAVMIR